MTATLTPTQVYGTYEFSPSATTVSQIQQSCIYVSLQNLNLSDVQLVALRSNLVSLKQLLEQEQTNIVTQAGVNASASQTLQDQQGSFSSVQTTLSAVITSLPPAAITSCQDLVQAVSDLTNGVVAEFASQNELAYRIQQLNSASAELAGQQQELLTSINNINSVIVAIGQLLGEL
jgi:hypothetical protein